jgi:anti-sigma factor RsiW
MNAMSCHEVEEQLDLLAAGECDPPTRQAIEHHLEQCPACSTSYAESRRLLGLLDLNWNEAGPARLRERIEEEDRRRWRRLILSPFVRRAAAVAALFLLAVGLIWWLPKRQPNVSEPELQLTLLVRDDEQARKAGPPIVVRSLPELAIGKTAAAFRQDLLQAQRDGKLPLPPAIPLALALQNTGDRNVEVQLGDAASELSLDVQGEGVVRIPVEAGTEPEFLQPRTLQLAPGERFEFHMDRLIAGSHGNLEYIYMTAPGDYTLSARLRVTAGGKSVTVGSEAIRVRVGD